MFTALLVLAGTDDDDELGVVDFPHIPTRGDFIRVGGTRWQVTEIEWQLPDGPRSTSSRPTMRLRVFVDVAESGAAGGKRQ